SLGHEVHGEETTERRDEEKPTPLMGDIPAEISAECEQARRYSDQTHRLAKQRPRLVAGQRWLNGCATRFHPVLVVSPCRFARQAVAPLPQRHSRRREP